MKMGSTLDYCLINFNNQNAPDNTGDFGGYDLAIPPTDLLNLPDRKSYDILSLIKPMMFSIHHKLPMHHDNGNGSY